jgi:FAD:protein FMN transferase
MKTQLLQAWSCTVRLVVADSRCLAPATTDLVELLNRVDRTASRFRPDSELSRANARAGRPTPVTRLLADLVAAALRAAAETDGAVDPTVGRAVAGLGYDADISELPPDGPAVTPIRSPHTWRSVRLVRSIDTLLVPPGTVLDLGATAKAYTADLAARQLAARYRTATLVEIGGDLAVAGAARWPIQVAELAGGPGQSVVLHDGGMATSTTTLRRWRRGGVELHHIVDPHTGAPASGPWRTVTVSAPTALAANTASTAAIVLGAEALGWLRAHHLSARLVDRDGSITTTGSWPTQVRGAA